MSSARALLLALALGILPGASALAASRPSNDEGRYRVYVRDRAIGDEEFMFLWRHDSLVVLSYIGGQILPARAGKVDTLRKQAALTLAAIDGGLRGYESREVLSGRLLRRELVIEGDTAYTSYRTTELGGEGNTLVRPPGRPYVIDPQVYTLFDCLLRALWTQQFDERPITLLYLFPSRDSAVDARIKRLGPEELRWGGSTVQAQKFSITDPWSEMFAWMSPEGQMLKLTFPAAGVRVERQPGGPSPPGATETRKPVPKRPRGR
jgi:hypothetical protein